MLSLLVTIAAVYALLLGTYFFTCFLVQFRNRAANKIQTRREDQDQMRRDRRQSVISLFSIATLFAGGQWMYQSLGWGFHPTGTNWVWTVLSFFVSMLLFDTWFYWAHRLIHTRLFYRNVHRWHHRTVSPEVWSNNSDTVWDNLFLQSYWLFAHFLFPVLPAVLLVHKVYDQIAGVIGHSGYEHAGVIALPPSPMVSVTHHDQHHRYARCNYATHFLFWDRLMGTLHPTHDAELRHNLRPASRE
jgi:lathosterol oxidase